MVLIDENFLRAKWPMWELGVMMSALPDSGQPQADTVKQAVRAVLPVVLMDFKAVTATYEAHWTSAATEAARGEGLSPATLADLQRMLQYRGDRQDQVQFAKLVVFLVAMQNATVEDDVAVVYCDLPVVPRTARTGLTVHAVLQYNLKRPTMLVDQIVERVLTKLKDLGRVPRDVTLNHSRRPAAWTLGCTTKPIIGREAEVERVLDSLRQHNAAVIWGGAGEGKTTIAMEAAARLRVEEPYLSAFGLDMQGVRACTWRHMADVQSFAWS